MGQSQTRIQTHACRQEPNVGKNIASFLHSRPATCFTGQTKEHKGWSLARLRQDECPKYFNMQERAMR
jgi:hypothetical protein